MTAISHRRELAFKARTLRRDLAESTASAVIGPITHGMEVFALTAGQFSLIDVIVHALNTIGPSNAVISTWTAGAADIGFCYKLLTDGRIRQMWFIVDFSFPARQPAYAQALRETFGNDAIRVSKNHAKFALLTNDGWNIAIRTTQNLNEAHRMEFLEISEDAPLVNFLKQFVDDVFAAQPADGQFDLRPIDHLNAFERMVEPKGKPDVATVTQAPDVKLFYSNEPYGNDLARSGLTYLGGKRK